MEYLYDFGLNENDINEMKTKISDELYSELCLFKNLVISNIKFLKNFGVTNYSEVIKRFPDIFLRDEESFQNILTKFDKEDLIQKVTKNATVIKKMVEFVDKN